MTKILPELAMLGPTRGNYCRIPNLMLCSVAHEIQNNFARKYLGEALRFAARPPAGVDRYLDVIAFMRDEDYKEVARRYTAGDIELIRLRYLAKQAEHLNRIEDRRHEQN